MSQEVVVPDVSEGVTSGTVISVAVAVGDEVEADQTLIELETDKAVVAIPRHRRQAKWLSCVSPRETALKSGR